MSQQMSLTAKKIGKDLFRIDSRKRCVASVASESDGPLRLCFVSKAEKESFRIDSRFEV